MLHGKFMTTHLAYGGVSTSKRREQEVAKVRCGSFFEEIRGWV